SPRELVKRGGFVLMACLALHDKAAPDKAFSAWLPLIEKGARDERTFVKKGVSWALRAIGRRNEALNAAAVATAERLAGSGEPAARWVGKDAVRELVSPKVRAALARRAGRKRRLTA
ncbi:MAG: DNA alkylation repair protein, partial [Gemmatimonadota bacterium]